MATLILEMFDFVIQGLYFPEVLNFNMIAKDILLLIKQDLLFKTCYL